jgi:hypothetical protein
MDPSTPCRCWRMKSRVAALDIDSQYVIFPLTGITTTSPGSVEDADGDTRDPRGRGSEACFEGYGRVNVKVSGDGVVDVYGHTMACVWVRDKA